MASIALAMRLLSTCVCAGSELAASARNRNSKEQAASSTGFVSPLGDLKAGMIGSVAPVVLTQALIPLGRREATMFICRTEERSAEILITC